VASSNSLGGPGPQPSSTEHLTQLRSAACVGHMLCDKTGNHIIHWSIIVTVRQNFLLIVMNEYEKFFVATCYHCMVGVSWAVSECSPIDFKAGVKCDQLVAKVLLDATCSMIIICVSSLRLHGIYHVHYSSAWYGSQRLVVQLYLKKPLLCWLTKIKFSSLIISL
jgi:hypothetical protein